MINTRITNNRAQILSLASQHGIIIAMYYNDHAPPHFHARYSGSEIRVNIDTGEILSGRFPRRAQSLVLEWLDLHRSELLEDWQLAQERKLLNKIEPLE